jgi:hypothetical protein
MGADGGFGLGWLRILYLYKIQPALFTSSRGSGSDDKIGANQILPDSFVKEVPRVLLCLLPPLVKHIEIVFHLGRRTTPLKHRRRRMFKIGVPTKPKP